MNELEQAASIQRAAKQLYRLVKLKAPPIVIEGARYVLATRVIRFPVDAAAQAAHQSIHQGLEKEQQDFLLKHGFYDDIIASEAEASHEPE